MSETLEIVETLAPLHPGELLREEFMVPLGLTPGKVAKAIGVPRTRIERIVAGEVGISGDTALRLARLFNMSPQYWANAQSHYDLEMAALKIGSKIEQIRPIASAA
jgi:addiction module HigA family antidote